MSTSNTDFPNVWDIYDLTNDELLALSTRINGGEASYASVELREAVKLEMDERSLAHKLFVDLKSTATVPNSQSVDETSANAGAGNIAPSPTIQSKLDWLQYCPPWYQVTNKEDGNEGNKGEGEEKEEEKAAIEEAAKKPRGMWDASSSSDEDDVGARSKVPMKKVIKKKRNGVTKITRMNSIGIFVVETRRRAKKVSGAAPPNPIKIQEKKPAVPRLGASSKAIGPKRVPSGPTTVAPRLANTTLTKKISSAVPSSSVAGVPKRSTIASKSAPLSSVAKKIAAAQKVDNDKLTPPAVAEKAMETPPPHESALASTTFSKPSAPIAKEMVQIVMKLPNPTDKKEENAEEEKDVTHLSPQPTVTTPATIVTETSVLAGENKKAEHNVEVAATPAVAVGRKGSDDSGGAKVARFINGKLEISAGPDVVIPSSVRDSSSISNKVSTRDGFAKSGGDPLRAHQQSVVVDLKPSVMPPPPLHGTKDQEDDATADNVIAASASMDDPPPPMTSKTASRLHAVIAALKGDEAFGGCTEDASRAEGHARSDADKKEKKKEEEDEEEEGVAETPNATRAVASSSASSSRLPTPPIPMLASKPPTPLPTGKRLPSTSTAPFSRHPTPSVASVTDVGNGGRGSVGSAASKRRVLSSGVVMTSTRDKKGGDAAPQKEGRGSVVISPSPSRTSTRLSNNTPFGQPLPFFAPPSSTTALSLYHNVTIPPSQFMYANLFPLLEDFLIEPFHLQPYSKLPTAVLIQALEKLQSDLALCKKECEELYADEDAEDESGDDDDGDETDSASAEESSEERQRALAAKKAAVLAEGWNKPFNGYLCKIQRTRTEVYSLILSSLVENDEEDSDADSENAGSDNNAIIVNNNWREVDSPLWNLWWSWNRPLPRDAVWLAVQKANHIPKSKELTHKDLLKRNLFRYAKGRGPGAAAFKEVMPVTFVLPSEYLAFVEAFGELKGSWIIKVLGQSRGRGIQVINRLEKVAYSDPVVIQRYVDRPLLIEGHKFDMRLYVLVTQFSPLECFVSSLGFARIASKPYAVDTIDDKYAHITNTSVANEFKQRQAVGDWGNAADGDDDDDASAKQAFMKGHRTDTKWLLSKLAAFVDAHHGKGQWARVWESIGSTILKSLACAEDNIPHNPCCFELFGYDILLDERLHPWLLEVNASPAMDVEGPEDKAVKPTIIKDTVALLDLPPINRDALAEVVGVRLHALTAKRQSHRFTPHDTEVHLRAVLGEHPIRPYGEMPVAVGHYERLAPSSAYDFVLKQKRTSV